MAVQNQIEWLTVKEASEFLKLKVPTLYQKVQRGGIPFYRPAGSKVIRFNKAELNAWMMGGIRKEVTL